MMMITTTVSKMPVCNLQPHIHNTTERTTTAANSMFKRRDRDPNNFYHCLDNEQKKRFLYREDIGAYDKDGDIVMVDNLNNVFLKAQLSSHLSIFASESHRHEILFLI